MMVIGNPDNGAVKAIHYRGFAVSLHDRFMTKVEKSDGCWVWRASTDSRTGYGRFGLHPGAAPWLAHRVSYSLFVGPIPDGLWVLHHCDNPPCVRPDHLFVGTHGDNMADAAAKGRLATGEKNGQAKLTAEKVGAIRREYVSGSVSHRELAGRYGVGRSHIGAILRGERWGWLAREAEAQRKRRAAR
jgi:hypothetical protein